MNIASDKKEIIPEDFRPKQTPHSLRVIMGKANSQDINRSNVVIKELGEVKLIGFRVLCGNKDYQEEIHKAACILQERVKEIKHVMNSGRQVGAYIVEDTVPEKDGYWVCVQVSSFQQVPEDMVTLTVPPQKYVTMMHKGPNTLIGKSYEVIHNWMVIKDLKRASYSWKLELYQANEINPTDLHVELYDSIY
ncbi:GyrI-like domain-containing protein [Ornithinibacillus xuwenensis]|uniref:GyrI-like domain-containing protein n=1 Tax=Ornithinibacillus xuwenensis TaxID=3144668 RepID=A0ABU9XHY1_9BACI